MSALHRQLREEAKEAALNLAIGLLWVVSVLSLVVAALLAIDHHYVIAGIVAAPVTIYGIHYIGETIRI